MICVKKDLIAKDIERAHALGFEFHYRKLSNKFIDWLFRHYYVHEIVENFYDSEPRFDEEEFNMYMDYEFIHKRISDSSTALFNTILNLEEINKQGENFRFSKKEHTPKELELVYKKITKQIENHKLRKLEILNWQEPYFKGNWGMSQKYVDFKGKQIFKQIRSFPFTIKNRLYIAKKDDQIRIYFYGRDLWERDYWFIFKKRRKKL